MLLHFAQCMSFKSVDNKSDIQCERTIRTDRDYINNKIHLSIVNLINWIRRKVLQYTSRNYYKRGLLFLVWMCENWSHFRKISGNQLRALTRSYVKFSGLYQESFEVFDTSVSFDLLKGLKWSGIPPSPGGRLFRSKVRKIFRPPIQSHKN